MKKFIAAFIAAALAAAAGPAGVYAAPAATLKVISQPVYTDVGSYSEGLCWVTKDGFTYQYIDENGRVAIDGLTFAGLFGAGKSFLLGSTIQCGQFSGGLAAVIGNPQGLAPRTVYIDKTGKIALNADKALGGYVYGGQFSGGSALCAVFDASASFTGEVLLRADGSSVKYSDNPNYNTDIRLSGGLIPFTDGTGLYGYADAAMNTVIKPQFDDAFAFCDGYAAASQNGSWGVIDKTGAFIIKPRFDAILATGVKADMVFSEGLASAEKDGAWGYIDQKGNPVGGFSWDFASPMSCGLGTVVKDDLYGYVDGAGNTVIAPQYDDANSFFEGFALVGKDGVYKLIDKTGAASAQTWNFSATLTTFDAPQMIFFTNSGHNYGIAKIIIY